MHNGPILSVASLDNNRLALTAGNTICLWDISRRTNIARLEGHTDTISILLPLSENRLVSVSNDLTVRLWDTSQPAEIGSYDCNLDDEMFALLPVRILKSTSDQSTIRLWDVNPNLEPLMMKTHRAVVRALIRLPEDRLASAGRGGAIRIWSSKSGDEIGHIAGGAREVRCLTKLPGLRLASAGDDGTVRISNVSTCREECRLEIDAPVRQLVSLRDGNVIAIDSLSRMHWLEVVEC